MKFICVFIQTFENGRGENENINKIKNLIQFF